MSLNLQYEPEVVVDITGLSNEDWLEYRKSGIGGSDAGIILGVSSYKLPRDVYFEKIGRTPDMPEDENWVTLEVGKRLEDLVAEIFAKKTGFRVWKENRMLRHPLYPYMIADIDYMYETSSGEIGILECKTGSHYVKDKWDGGAVPYTYEVQCRHYMAVRNVFASYAACLHGNTENDFIYQKIERDLDFEEDLIEQEGMFWYDYVEKQKEPPLTGDGDLMLRSLKRYQAERNQQEELLFDDVYGDVFEKILEMKNEKSALDKAGRELEGKIKTLYAQFAAMLGSGTKGKCVADGCEYLITYKPSYRTLIPKEAMERMKLNDKEMFDKYASVSESRTFQVKKVIK